MQTIEFEVYEKIKEYSDTTNYMLGIKVNGKTTPFTANTETFRGEVKGDITINFDDFENFGDTYKIKVDGNIRHFKKQVIEEWDKIKSWAKPILDKLLKEIQDVIEVVEE